MRGGLRRLVHLVRAVGPLRAAAAATVVAGGGWMVLLLLWWLLTRRRPVGGDVVVRMWHRESSPATGPEPDRLSLPDMTPGERPDGGRAVPVVLLHGLGMSSRSMVALLRALGAHTRTLAPDLPGYGRSPQPRAGMLGVEELARTVVAWLDEAGLDEVLLVGHSLGAQVAGEVALRAPGRVRRLVLVAPTGDPERRSVLELAWGLARDAPTEPPSLLLTATMDYLRAGPGQMVTLMNRALRRSIERLDARVEVPLLVVRGERDPVCRQGWCERIVAGTPGARLHVLPGAAHGAAATPGDELVGLLLDELRRAGPVADA